MYHAAMSFTLFEQYDPTMDVQTRAEWNPVILNLHRYINLKEDDERASTQSSFWKVEKR